VVVEARMHLDSALEAKHFLELVVKHRVEQPVLPR